MAADKGHDDVAKLLLRYGADPNAGDNDGRTPLDVARERGFDNIVEILSKQRPGVTFVYK